MISKLVLPILAGNLLILSGAPTHAADALDPLDETAAVSEISTSSSSACKPSTGSADHDDYFWGLVENKSQFEFQKLGGRWYHVGHTSPEVDQTLKDPDFLLVSLNQPKIGAFTCARFTNVLEYKILFSITDIENPENHKPSLHALVYIPIRVSDNGKTIDVFFLYVLGIANDTVSCSDLTDAVEKARCVALRYVAAAKLDGKPISELNRRIADNIYAILAPLNSASGSSPGPTNQKMLYHNGIIHGVLQ